MKWPETFRFFALSFALGVSASAFGQQIPFTQLDYQFPDGTKADSTQAWGINPRGDIVGFYVKAGVSHGFLRSGDGSYTPIDYPGASSTSVTAINARGDIVGSYMGGGVTRGFLLSEGNYSTIDLSAYVPGVTSSEVLGIADNGDLTGDYSLTNTIRCCSEGTHGFLLSNGNFIPVDFPAAGVTLTFANGINSQGSTVGAYSINNTGARAFLLDHSNYIPLQYPDAGTTFMNALGIDARGDIVGRYVNATGRHGYVLTQKGFTTIDIPGATFTGARAINSEGDIVGRYVGGGVFHGFLLSRHEEAR
jgi:uncharacterized membrane protein